MGAIFFKRLLQFESTGIADVWADGENNRKVWGKGVGRGGEEKKKKKEKEKKESV